MQYPDSSFGRLCTSAAEAERQIALDPRKPAVCGLDAGMQNGIHKISPLPPEEFEKLRSVCDMLFIEADGAKMKPIKAPDTYEPVLPASTDVIMVSAGLDALGGRLEDVCFRKERAVEILWPDTGTADDGTAEKYFSHIITDSDIARILCRGYILPLLADPDFYGVKVTAMLNKADTENHKKEARLIAEKIKRLVKAEIVDRGRLGDFTGTNITSFADGTYEYEVYH
jgi:hypothetical protein